jgi:hypothetical protein
MFTGQVSTPPQPFPWAPHPHAIWRGWQEIRADARSSVRLALVLAAAGIPAGLAWWALAPRATFRITEAGPQPLGPVPSDELLIADDMVFLLVLAVVGLVAGAVAWQLRRLRGVATVLALAVGSSVCAVVAWQLGELLGAGPTQAQLAEVGARVTTSLTLGSPAALAVAPFAALLAYVGAALAAHDDGLGRTPVRPEHELPPTGAPLAGAPDPHRPMVDVPPGRPQA